MKRLPIILAIITGVLLVSCSQKTPNFVNSIPDDAILVVSMHPMKIHTKGKLNSFESIKEKVKDEIWGQIIENPLSSGMMLDEYVYLFATLEEEAPVVGVVAGIRDMGKFENTLSKIDKEEEIEPIKMEGYKYIQPDQEGIIAWNEEQMIVLASADHDEFEPSFWTSSLDWMFNPVKEESIVSLVDFKEFQGKMKDINLWLSADDLKNIVDHFSDNHFQDIPINLYNNYTHIYCDFSKGAMNITGETNFSEEVQKNLDEVLVLNPSLNQDMLKIAPGGNLLLALATSMDLEKIQKLVAKINPPQLDEMGGKVEAVTGIPTETLINAFTGDLTFSVNGLSGEALIPVEVFIGLGVKSDEIQSMLLEQVGSMLPVEEQGDFFVINIQGNEIYSGIVNDNWVITNVKGYKEKVKNGKIDNSLLDSKFAEFADKSVGMYINLDLDSYPKMAKDILEQRSEQGEWIEELTASLDYLGMSSGDKQSLFTVKTNKPNENSLYTMLRIAEAGE
jgi:Domain of unknown function (DUF4836)